MTELLVIKAGSLAKCSLMELNAFISILTSLACLCFRLCGFCRVVEIEVTGANAHANSGKKSETYCECCNQMFHRTRIGLTSTSRSAIWFCGLSGSWLKWYSGRKLLSSAL